MVKVRTKIQPGTYIKHSVAGKATAVKCGENKGIVANRGNRFSWGPVGVIQTNHSW